MIDEDPTPFFEYEILKIECNAPAKQFPLKTKNDVPPNPDSNSNIHFSKKKTPEGARNNQQKLAK